MGRMREMGLDNGEMRADSLGAGLRSLFGVESGASTGLIRDLKAFMDKQYGKK